MVKSLKLKSGILLDKKSTLYSLSRFRAITHAYYRGVVGAMICYDMTKENTFNNVDKWV